ncbi:MAG: hypothetical protein LIP03_12630 [Bacteroidales bacterium]|nr:hypothetical protein [Bacteroidales bacterium]
MKIIFVHKKGEGPRASLARLLDERGVRVEPLERAALSAFTSMRLAKAIDRTAAQAVLVTTIPDAMAAVSARKLAKSKFRIICAPRPNEPVPTGLAEDIRRGVDAWVFPSERQRQAYPQDLNRAEVIGLVDPDFSPTLPQPGAVPRIVWIGPIDGNTQRLIRAIEQIDLPERDCELMVCGTAKAQSVMPAVHRSRAINHPERVMWTGENYELADEAAKGCAIVQSGLDPDPIETAACGQHPLLQPEQLAAYLNGNPDVGLTYSLTDSIDKFPYLLQTLN